MYTLFVSKDFGVSYQSTSTAKSIAELLRCFKKAELGKMTRYYIANADGHPVIISKIHLDIIDHVLAEAKGHKDFKFATDDKIVAAALRRRGIEVLSTQQTFKMLEKEPEINVGVVPSATQEIAEAAKTIGEGWDEEEGWIN
jgi:hypothetical protein